MFSDHRVGCPLHEPVHWLRAAAVHAAGMAALVELVQPTPGIRSGTRRLGAPVPDEQDLAWCTCRSDAGSPDGQE